ncbi:MAG TPA: DUF3135 domain-containing protein, partial [Pseudomonadales bacterium]|nr:DUF3135 domain-containing protein [Pseudomonadales bacterium]
MSSTLPSFDELMNLAKNDPEGLEALRTRLVEDLITSAPTEYQRRLRGLQFQIDMERRRAHSPMAACIRISNMMHESLDRLREALNQARAVASGQLDGVLEAFAEEETSKPAPAMVIPFP